MLDYIIYLLSVLWALFLGKNAEEQFEQGNQSIGSCRKSQLKGPQVATIVLAERDGRRINIQQVARLIHWCTLEDLQYIFLYDPEGVGSWGITSMLGSGMKPVGCALPYMFDMVEQHLLGEHT